MNVSKRKSFEYLRAFECPCEKKLFIMLMLFSLGVGCFRPLVAQELLISSIEIQASTNIDYPDKRFVQLSATGWSDNVTILLALGTKEGRSTIKQTFYTMHWSNQKYIYAHLPGEEPIEVMDGNLQLMFDDYIPPVPGTEVWLTVQVYDSGVLKDRKSFRIR